MSSRSKHNIPAYIHFTFLLCCLVILSKWGFLLFLNVIVQWVSKSCEKGRRRLRNNICFWSCFKANRFTSSLKVNVESKLGPCVHCTMEGFMFIKLSKIVFCVLHSCSYFTFLGYYCFVFRNLWPEKQTIIIEHKN